MYLLCVDPVLFLLTQHLLSMLNIQHVRQTANCPLASGLCFSLPGTEGLPFNCTDVHLESRLHYVAPSVSAVTLCPSSGQREVHQRRAQFRALPFKGTSVPSSFCWAAALVQADVSKAASNRREERSSNRITWGQLPS